MPPYQMLRWFPFALAHSIQGARNAYVRSEKCEKYRCPVCDGQHWLRHPSRDIEARPDGTIGFLVATNSLLTCAVCRGSTFLVDMTSEPMAETPRHYLGFFGWRFHVGRLHANGELPANPSLTPDERDFLRSTEFRVALLQMPVFALVDVLQDRGFATQAMGLFSCVEYFEEHGNPATGGPFTRNDFIQAYPEMEYRSPRKFTWRIPGGRMDYPPL